MKTEKLSNPILKKLKKIKAEYLLDFEDIEVPETEEGFYELIKPWFMKCENCILHTNRNTVVAPDGIPNSPIMIVLEGPGFLEDRSGVPLVGPLELQGSRCSTCSGCLKCYDRKLLNRVYGWKKGNVPPECKEHQTINYQLPNNFYLHSTGSIIDGILINSWKFSYPRHNWVTQYNENNKKNPWEHKSPFFITNAVLCRAVDLLTGKDTRPKRAHWDQCRKWLIYQWIACNPKIIICFGRTALAAIIGNEAAALRVKPNEIIETKLGPVVFNNHPSYFMREQNQVIKELGYSKLKRTFEIALNYCEYPT